MWYTEYQRISNPTEYDYLSHYGVPHGKGPSGRGSGRYPFGFRKNPRATSAEKKRKKTESLKRSYEKSETKLKKIKAKSDIHREKANKEFAKANKKLYGFMGGEKKASKYFQKANKEMRKVEKLEYKGANWYKKMDKKFSKVNIKQSKEVRKIGNDFIKSINDRSVRRSDIEFVNAMDQAGIKTKKKKR